MATVGRNAEAVAVSTELATGTFLRTVLHRRAVKPPGRRRHRMNIENLTTNRDTRKRLTFTQRTIAGWDTTPGVTMRTITWTTRGSTVTSEEGSGRSTCGGCTAGDAIASGLVAFSSRSLRMTGTGCGTATILLSTTTRTMWAGISPTTCVWERTFT